MSKYLASILIALAPSTVFANGYVKIAGERYQVSLSKTACIPPAFDEVLNQVALTVHEEMKRAECKILAGPGGEPYDCSAIDRAFAVKSILLRELREKEHCSCKTGPVACVASCKNFLPANECSSICIGSCDLPFPRK